MVATNFPDGVNNVYDYTTMGGYGGPDPSKYHTWYDDFDNYTAADWVITTTGTGTVVVQNEVNGIIRVTNSAADDDAVFLQWSGDTNAAAVETWKFIAGKELWFKTKFKVSDATQSDLVMGLQITDTTPLAVTDGVYFLKADGSATLNLLVTKNSTSTTTAVTTMVADTYVTVGFYYDGKSSISIFLNDQKIGSSVTTNLVDDEELTISWGCQNGEAVAKTMNIDYILVSETR